MAALASLGLALQATTPEAIATAVLEVWDAQATQPPTPSPQRDRSATQVQQLLGMLGG